MVTILRLPRVDEAGAFAVLRVENTKSSGKLRLTGTEGEAPYVGSGMIPMMDSNGFGPSH
jgi:hypothetical protein